MPENILEDLLEQIEKNGIKCLLPQNLSVQILNKMLEEAEALDNRTTEETPSSLLLIAVLHLHHGGKLGNTTEIQIAPEKLMDYFSYYITSLRLEGLKREGLVDFTESSNPTLENIFDSTRMMGIKGFSSH